MNKITKIVATFFAVGLSFTGASSLAQSVNDEVLQCMADCVIQEGEDETETCKMRCAGLSVNMSEQPKDCMAVYKQCNKDCGDEQSCRKVCKSNLLNCV